MIEIDPAQLDQRERYFLLTGLVVPRPIGWISTVDAAGAANLAPHSYFNAVSSKPPIVMFCSGHSSPHDPEGRKDTIRNVGATGEFVANFVSADMMAAMNATSEEVPPGVDEFELAGLAKAPSARVKPPRVAGAKAALECRVCKLLEIGDATMVFGEIVYVHVDPEVWRNGRADWERMRPLARLGGSHYATLAEIIRLPRP